MKNIRFNVKEYGEAETLKRLEQNERYARGFAYDKNIDGLIERLEEYKTKTGLQDSINLDKCIAIVKEIRDTLKDEILVKMKDAAYDFSEGKISSEELVRLYEELKKQNSIR